MWQANDYFFIYSSLIIGALPTIFCISKLLYKIKTPRFGVVFHYRCTTGRNKHVKRLCLPINFFFLLHHNKWIVRLEAPKEMTQSPCT
ncbi:hypothetical protein IV203_026124 [Nitzschia inconspicua]|uniref:Uncharacterized protein n=1 Tax=Nitzschia inconspicua TaxID=303405 RepID=A0A9K3LHZ5_9STRA|nr:hypothetical protein IV203_026124 [Nitzschia inconspicua]